MYQVPAHIGLVTSMERLRSIAHEMDKKLERFKPISGTEGKVSQPLCVVSDPTDYTTLAVFAFV
jgi:hypothetical protein